MVLLLLQMTSSGGTFPTILSSDFFVAIHPFMPFTYLINALREVFSANPIDYGIVWSSLAVLLCVTAGVLAINVVFHRKGEQLVDGLNKALGA
jgi:putative membrane protein